jgi:hypothetical protein
MLRCGTCGQVTPHRPTPPDGWLRCRRCVPDAPVPVVVVNQTKSKGFFLHYVIPAIILAVIIGYAMKDHLAKDDAKDSKRAVEQLTK